MLLHRTVVLIYSTCLVVAPLANSIHRSINWLPSDTTTHKTAGASSPSCVPWNEEMTSSSSMTSGSITPSRGGLPTSTRT